MRKFIYPQAALSKICTVAVLLAAALSGGASLAAGLEGKPQARMEWLLGQKGFGSGPNCWNAALFTTGKYPYLALTSDAMATKLFNSCRKLDTSIEQAPLGSVVRYRGASGEEIHAFIKVSEGSYFQKRDNSMDGPYEIVSLKAIDAQYGKEANCGQGGDCGWSFQVLDCGGESEPPLAINKEVGAAIRAYSKLAFAQPGKIDEAMAAVRTQMRAVQGAQNAILNEIRAGKSPFLSPALMDLYQNNRFVALPGGAREQELAQLRKEGDEILWALFTGIVKLRNIDQKTAEGIYDFAYAATGHSGSPQDLVERLLARISLISTKEAALSHRILLQANPNFSYEGAEAAVNMALDIMEKKESPELAHAMDVFFGYAKASYPGRGSQFRRFISILMGHPVDQAGIVSLAYGILDSEKIFRGDKKFALDLILPKAQGEKRAEIESLAKSKLQ